MEPRPRAAADQHPEPVDEWLQSPERRAACEYGLPGLMVACPPALSCMEAPGAGGDWRFDVDDPPALRCWPLRAPGLCGKDVLLRPPPTLIKCSRDQVFKVITDYEKYGEWNPFQKQVAVVQHCDDPTRRSLQLRVNLKGRENVGHEEIFYVDSERFIICYGINNWQTPSWRSQWLTEAEGGHTWYHSYDVIGGPFSLVVRAFFQSDVLKGFTEQHEALRRRCQELYPA